MDDKKNAYDKKEYRRFLILHQLHDYQVGQMFGYKHRQAWGSTSKRGKIITGLLEVEKVVVARLKELAGAKKA
jgi:hypothetical protein